MREYATQMEAAKQGIITPEMKTVAEKEFTDRDHSRARRLGADRHSRQY